MAAVCLEVGNAGGDDDVDCASVDKSGAATPVRVKV